MNDYSHNAQSESEIEARIAAMVLGEASDLERDQLERLLAERPELAELKAHFEAVHGLLRDTETGEHVAADDEWKLPTEKRNALLAVIDGEANLPIDKSSVSESVVLSATPKRMSNKQNSLWKFSKTAAALCVAGCLGLLAMSGYFLVNLNSTSPVRHLAYSEGLAYKPNDTATVVPGSGFIAPQFRAGTDITIKLSAAQSAEEVNADKAQSSASSLLAIRESLSGDKSLPGQVASKDRVEYFDYLGVEPPPKSSLEEYESEAKLRAEKLERDFGRAQEARQQQLSAQAGQPSSSGASYGYSAESKDESTVEYGNGIDGFGLGMAGGGMAGGRMGGGGMGGLGMGGKGNAEEYGRRLGRAAGRELAEQRGQTSDRSYDILESELAREATESSRPMALGKEETKWNMPLEDSPSPEVSAESLHDPRYGIAQGSPSSSPSNQRPSLEDSKKLGDLADSNTDGRMLFGDVAVADGENIDLVINSGLSSQDSLAEESESLSELPADTAEEQIVVAGIQLGKTLQSMWGKNPLSNRDSLPKRSSAVASFEESNAADNAFSTFSLHVSDVSFKLAQAALASGKWPEAAKLRIEEFVNAFDYGDPLPSPSEKVACRVEQAIHPSLQQRNVLRVSLRTAATGRASNTPLRLTFLLDNSGSMERVDRQETVRRCFAMLAQQLTPLDQVTLISFARQPRLLADKISGDKAQQLVGLIEDLPSEGGTNFESALQLAFEKAREQQADGAQSRIILLTDGAVNLGDANPESLSHRITTIRDSGIAFDAAGISADGLNDEVLEALTRQGDGRYYLLDSNEAADDGFARQIAGALRPSAKNVKVQIEFNPKRVGHYKLLGFEKHLLKQEDFRDDNVDAAEMAAAEAGVAVYQFEAKPAGEGDVGSVSVRFLDLATGQMIENRWPIPYEADAPRLDQAAPALRLASSAALFAAKLRSDRLGETIELKTLADLVSSLPERVRKATRVEQLQQMIQQARQISGK